MPRTTLVTRIESDLKDRLGEAAKAHNRSVSNLVEWVLKQYLDQMTKRPILAPQEIEFPNSNELHSVLSQRRPTIADTLKYLENK